MAILKHKTNKNMNYEDALDYLLFQHDEYTMKPILDEQGRKQLRDEYYIDGINCEPMFFEKECEMVNKKYHKNYRYDEIKSHHYVLSFDPSDKTERGLTGEKAQQLGLEFARKNFPGHQMLVVTHTDGHNHSGNIHVHIVLNSVRKETVAEEDFMERPCDHKAGYKHHQTRAFLTHLQKSLMELCEREKLHQIDLLSPSASKITQEEYWAQRRGQKNLVEINKQIVEDGYIPTQTNFQTQKQKIRDAVDELAAVSKSFEDFQSQLFEKYKITVIEKRGRYSYHLPEREKNISERSLGTHYGKKYLSSIYGTKTKYITPEMLSMREYDPTYDYQADPIAILYIRSNLRLVTDLQTCVKAQQSHAYAHKVKLTNLKQMAETIVYVQEHGYDTRDDLQNQYKEILSKGQRAKSALNTVSAELKVTNIQLKHLGQYYANRRIYNQMTKALNKKNFRQEHQKEIAAYKESKAWLEGQFSEGMFPTIKELQTKKEALESRKKTLQSNYEYYRDYEKDLKTAVANVAEILAFDSDRQGVKQHEEELS